MELWKWSLPVWRCYINYLLKKKRKKKEKEEEEKEKEVIGEGRYGEGKYRKGSADWYESTASHLRLKFQNIIILILSFFSF